MHSVILVIIGILVGVVWSSIALHFSKAAGSLRLINTDPDEKTSLSLELNKTIDELANENFIVVYINRDHYVTRK